MADGDLWDKFWKDKHGNVVVYQHPNIFLIAWVILALISLFVNEPLSDLLWHISLGVLAIWSLLEIFKGVNYFRRLFGGFVLLLVVLAVFRVAI
ncbi:MAG TPA: hypothetical protein VGE30_01115 [Candidatus Saccharimonadales bacterium]